MFATETISIFWLKISAHKEGEGTAKLIKGKNVNNVGNERSFCKEIHALQLRAAADEHCTVPNGPLMENVTSLTKRCIL